MKEKISNVINELLQRYKTVGSITDDDIIELILKYTSFQVLEKNKRLVMRASKRKKIF